MEIFSLSYLTIQLCLISSCRDQSSSYLTVPPSPRCYPGLHDQIPTPNICFSDRRREERGKSRQTISVLASETNLVPITSGSLALTITLSCGHFSERVLGNMPNSLTGISSVRGRKNLWQVAACHRLPESALWLTA